MNDKNQRIDEFKSEIEGLKLKGSSAEGENKLLVAGLALVGVGVVLAIGAAIRVASYGDSAGDQRAIVAQGSLLGIVLVIAGAALFIRFSLARYMRFWLIRLTYESRANTDRIVDAIERASGLPPEETTADVRDPHGADVGQTY